MWPGRRGPILPGLCARSCRRAGADEAPVQPHVPFPMPSSIPVPVPVPIFPFLFPAPRPRPRRKGRALQHASPPVTSRQAPRAGRRAQPLRGRALRSRSWGQRLPRRTGRCSWGTWTPRSPRSSSSSSSTRYRPAPALSVPGEGAAGGCAAAMAGGAKAAVAGQGSAGCTCSAVAAVSRCLLNAFAPDARRAP